MSNLPDPLAAGNADFWPSKGIIPVPLNDDGSYPVEPVRWATKTDEEIIGHFKENPTQDFDLMMPKGYALIIAYEWNAFVKARPHFRQSGFIEKYGVDFIGDDSEVKVIIVEHDGDADVDGIRDTLGKTNTLFMPSLTYNVGNDDTDQSNLPVEGLTDVTAPKRVPPTPFDKYSLLGSEAEMERFAVNAVALLGSVIMMGQFGLIYAQPNTGKTLLTIALLLEAVEEKRLDPRLCYYINADDNNEGILEKLRLFNEMGAHTLVPGHKNFDPEKLIELMLAMVKDDQCKGVVLILDTLKCFIDLMDKKRSTQFAKVVRQFVVAGGTFVGLAHTNKNPGGNGKPVYAGTSDFHEACDVACYLIPVENTDQGDKVVKFELFKKRGGGNRNEAYSFSGLNDASYHQLVASVQKIDPDEMLKYEQSAQLVADQLVVDAICNALNDTPQQKMALAKHVSTTIKASRRQVIEVLERYAGSDPEFHRWDFVVAERGAKVFALHPPQTP